MGDTLVSAISQKHMMRWSVTPLRTPLKIWAVRVASAPVTSLRNKATNMGDAYEGSVRQGGRRIRQKSQTWGPRLYRFSNRLHSYMDLNLEWLTISVFFANNGLRYTVPADPIHHRPFSSATFVIAGLRKRWHRQSEAIVSRRIPS